MKLSLIIPCAHTPMRYFAPCMERVAEEMEKGDWDVIISEDGPVSEEMRALYPPKARVIEHKEKSGCGLARKRAMTIADGDWMCFLDSDDIMCRGYYDKVVDAIEANSDKYCVEFNFTNIYHIEDNPNPIIVMTDEMSQEDFTKTTYGNFSHEMVWNKVYRSDKVREILGEYNPPLLMTPGEDLLWNAIFNAHYGDKYGWDHHLLLDRIVRDTGLAHSTAADDRNRLKTMQIALDAANKINSFAPVCDWIKHYMEEVECRLKEAHKHCSGMRWSEEREKTVFTAHSVMTPITFTLLNKCNEECPYCCNSRSVECRKEPWPDFDFIAAKFEEYLDYVIEKTGHTMFNLTGGECTMVGYERLQPIFERHPDIEFRMFTNGKLLDRRWLEIPNVRYKVHCVDSKPNIEWLFSKKVETIVWINDHSDDGLLECWKKLQKRFHNIEIVEDMNFRQPSSEREKELCRKVFGVLSIYVETGLVTCCCGWRQKYMSTGDIYGKWPEKKDNICDGCCNPSDNSYIEM